MQNDSISYDTLNSRQLPRWLVDQKAGFTAIQPQKIVMKEDHSLKISFILTSTIILFAVAVLTVYFLKKYKNRL
jgi:heme/copper-type cytochrome/quinol oxidase subunit 2